jgi:hypothetical protein
VLMFYGFIEEILLRIAHMKCLRAWRKNSV